MSTFSPGIKSGPAQKFASVREGKVLVVGAGAFGGWTALTLLRAGYQVTLIEKEAPGNSRSSSGGESRLIRAFYGESDLYFRMTRRAWDVWLGFEKDTGHEVICKTGVLWLFPEQDESQKKQIIDLLSSNDHPHQVLDNDQLQEQHPLMNAEGVNFAILEQEAGYLHARKAIQWVVDQFVAEGGRYLRGVAEWDHGEIKVQGKQLKSDAVILACGPWLKRLLPELDVHVTRQEVLYFGQSMAADVPAWIEYRDEGSFYGIPDHGQQGFKIAHDVRGPEFDPESSDRTVDETGLQKTREFMEFRFPFMKAAPLVESRVCQYTNSSDGNFIFCKLDGSDTWILGGGSGHGFKHGPAIGELVRDSLQSGQIPGAFSS